MWSTSAAPQAQRSWRIDLDGTPLVVTQKIDDLSGFQRAVDLLGFTTRHNLVLTAQPAHAHERYTNLDSHEALVGVSTWPHHWSLLQVSYFLRLSWQEVLVRERLGHLAALTSAPSRMHFPVIQFTHPTWATTALVPLAAGGLPQFDKYTWYMTPNAMLDHWSPAAFLTTRQSEARLQRAAETFATVRRVSTPP